MPFFGSCVGYTQIITDVHCGTNSTQKNASQKDLVKTSNNNNNNDGDDEYDDVVGNKMRSELLVTETWPSIGGLGTYSPLEAAS